MRRYLECYKCGAENECDCANDCETITAALRELHQAASAVSIKTQWQQRLTDALKASSAALAAVDKETV